MAKEENKKLREQFTKKQRFVCVNFLKNQKKKSTHVVKQMKCEKTQSFSINRFSSIDFLLSVLQSMSFKKSPKMSSIEKFSSSIFYSSLPKSSILVETSLFAFNKKQGDTTLKTNEIAVFRSLIHEESAHNIKFKTKIAKFETKIAKFKTKAAEFMTKVKEFKTKVAAFMTDVTES